jgi:hypothetical protein
MAETEAQRAHRLKEWRERRAMKRAQKGDSPEKQAGRHTPPEGVIDKMLRIGGVERESRFKKD